MLGNPYIGAVKKPLRKTTQRPRPRRRRGRRPAAETRAHVLDVAHELFYWTGIRATGVDRVAAKAGVAPTALYRLFPSKEAIVAAYLERAEQRYREWFEGATVSDGRTPAERIVALFDSLAEQVRPERCRGCPFLMALAEVPDAGTETHRSAVRLKEWVHARFHSLAQEHAAQCSRSAASSGAADSAFLADHLTLLFEGVYASVQALGADGPARRARELAASLVAPRTVGRARG